MSYETARERTSVYNDIMQAIEQSEDVGDLLLVRDQFFTDFRIFETQAEEYPESYWPELAHRLDESFNEKKKSILKKESDYVR